MSDIVPWQTPTLPTQILFLMFLIGLNALFACVEIAVISFNDKKLDILAKTGDNRAIKLVQLTEQPAKFLSTIQVGITLAGSFASAFAADNFAPIVTDFFIETLKVNIPRTSLNLACVFLITIVLSYFNLVFGELVPKRIAMKKSESIALFFSGFIFFIARIFSPVVWFLTLSTNTILKLIGIDPNDEESDVTEEEIRMLIDAGTERGTIDQDEKRFINNIFEFDNKIAEDVMTHRTDAKMLWLEEDNEEWEKTLFSTRHSFYPICGETFDIVVGVLDAREYFKLKNDLEDGEEISRDLIMEKAVAEPQFVPETVRTDFLFRNMKEKKEYFAIVMDDYGGVSGIVTVHDLLEQIVGDLDDVDDDEVDPEIIKISDNSWEVIGAVNIEDVCRETGANLNQEEYETFAGMVFGLMGTIPDDGTQPELTEKNINVKVLEIKNHRLLRSLLTIMDDSDSDAVAE